MKKTFFIFTLFFLILSVGILNAEKLKLKSGDTYTGNLVLTNKNTTVFLLFGDRQEFKNTEIAVIDYDDPDIEYELVLKDKSVLKGSIVTYDDEFLTVGTGAGLTTINRNKISAIRNPKHKSFYNAAKAVQIDFHIGMTPATTFVLNDFANSYQAYWSYELYFESTFFTHVWFGFDATFLMLSPKFKSASGKYNDFLFIIPINFTIKYQDNFYRHKDPNHPLRKLFWHIKLGFGFAPAIFTEIEENNTRVGMSFSSDIDYGIKYYIKPAFGIGLSGKTNLIVQEGSYIITQSAGLNLEFKF